MYLRYNVDSTCIIFVILCYYEFNVTSQVVVPASTMPSNTQLHFRQPAVQPPKHIFGADVHVIKQGRLWLKNSFLRPRRCCEAQLKGLRLRLTTNDPHSSCLYNLTDATLTAHASTLKLIVRLADGFIVQLHADTISDFNDWSAALSDALYWSLERFYELGPTIGSGAFAAVKRARHRETNDDVAVKIITKSKCSETEMRYLQREVDIALTLRHPNIVRTSDLFQSKEKLYIVLEFVPGGTLQTAVESFGPFSEYHNRAIMTDLLKAVKYIHGRGIVHRDLKVRHICVPFSRYVH